MDETVRGLGLIRSPLPWAHGGTGSPTSTAGGRCSWEWPMGTLTSLFFPLSYTFETSHKQKH